MKLSDAITEQKKVRCSGCNLVIIVEPDPANPGQVLTSIPKPREKRKGLTEDQKKYILYGVAGLLAVGAIIFLYSLFFGGPPLRGGVEGDVTWDGSPLEKGRIVFEPTDTSKGGKVVETKIERGHYDIAAFHGPFIGVNRVRIFGSDAEPVAAQWNTESEEKFEIKAGANKANYAVTSKKTP
jgi:hypothetical protein